MESNVTGCPEGGKTQHWKAKVGITKVLRKINYSIRISLHSYFNPRKLRDERLGTRGAFGAVEYFI